MTNEARLFKNPDEFRGWLHKHHRTSTELLVEFLKTHTGVKCMTWPESVAEALCYGWIDGVRRRLDDERYTIRFTPRRKSSIWSAVNIRLIAKLEAEGKMTEAGRAAFEVRPHKSGPQAQGYTAQKKDGALDGPRLREFKKHKVAWEFFGLQPPGYRKAAAWWVMQAKREETRARRITKLIEQSAAGKRLM